MVTTNCLELTGQGNCTVPLSGGSLDELKGAIFAHAQEDHRDVVANMSAQDQANMLRRIEEVFNQKAESVSSR